MIKLSGKYYMDADDRQFILKRIVSYNKKDSDEIAQREEVKGYFTSIESLIGYLVNQILRDKIQENSLSDLNQCMDELKNISQQINKLSLQ